MKPGMPMELKDLTKTPAYKAADAAHLAMEPGVQSAPLAARAAHGARASGIDWWLPRVAFGGVLACLVVLGLLWICGGGR